MSTSEDRPAVVVVNSQLTIPLEEIQFTSDRSSGPGGQNVNKVATRVTLRFDLNDSASLTPSQRDRIHEQLATRINREGILRVVSSRHRTQEANRRAALERFAQLLQAALEQKKPRKPSKVPASVKRKRLEDKAHRAKKKEQRRPPGYQD